MDYTSTADLRYLATMRLPNFVRTTPFKSLAELCAFLGMASQTVYSWRRRGKGWPVLARLLDKAIEVPWKDWSFRIKGSGGRFSGIALLDEETGEPTGKLCAVLMKSCGVAPRLVREWAKSETSSPQEKLAIIVYYTLVRNHHGRVPDVAREARPPKHLGEEATALVIWARVRRMELNYTLKELAEYLKCPVDHCRRLETGRSGVVRRTGKPTGALRTYVKTLESIPPNLKEHSAQQKPRKRRVDFGQAQRRVRRPEAGENAAGTGAALAAEAKLTQITGTPSKKAKDDPLTRSLFDPKGVSDEGVAFDRRGIYPVGSPESDAQIADAFKRQALHEAGVKRMRARLEERKAKDGVLGFSPENPEGSE